MRRLAALLTAAALAAALVACGDDDSGDSGSAAEVRAAQAEADAKVAERNAEVRDEFEERKQAEAPTPDEQEAEEQAESFYDVLAKDTAKSPNRTEIDAESFCDLMSEEAQEQTVEYAKRSSGIAKQWDCEAAVELLVLRSKRFGAFKDVKKAEVLGINAEGDRATATIRFGNGVATSVPMVKEDGEWKLAANELGAE